MSTTACGMPATLQFTSHTDDKPSVGDSWPIVFQPQPGVPPSGAPAWGNKHAFTSMRLACPSAAVPAAARKRDNPNGFALFCVACCKTVDGISRRQFEALSNWNFDDPSGR
eukprot:CAMPEP_0171907096 /NCGR_PEP_ID=MMETSP0993-20121228/6762_1 /TAXON_ID=483369 /ORGANISM="non described non described, Strain CCMP2098" /LENGTH=110 /DNA_ID=CAMNT_0012539259 /DNA_START=91 /DNA_END=423 /DNA_ORIENTATION=+